MKLIKLSKANKLISKKLVIERSRENILIGSNCNIWNCSKGADNIISVR